MACDKKYGHIEIPGIPEMEPVFIIRAKDAAALNAIWGYENSALAVGASASFVRDVQSVRAAFAEWQNENPDVVKVPD